jgi:hypothetical protein
MLHISTINKIPHAALHEDKSEVLGTQYDIIRYQSIEDAVKHVDAICDKLVDYLEKEGITLGLASGTASRSKEGKA